MAVDAREEGTYAKRHPAARQDYRCSDCRGLIGRGQTYWYRFGSCHPKSCPPFVVRTCEPCESAQKATV